MGFGPSQANGASQVNLSFSVLGFANQLNAFEAKVSGSLDRPPGGSLTPLFLVQSHSNLPRV